MSFGSVPVDRAEGAILAHSLAVEGGRIRKGTRLGPREVDRLRASGFRRVTVVRPADGEVGEDRAARRIAEAAAGPGTEVDAPAAGRCNVRAAVPGLLEVDRERIHGANRVGAGITLATAAPSAPVAAGDLVATAKVVPLVVAGEVLARVERRLGGGPPLRVRPFRSRAAGLLLTRLPGSRPTLDERARAATRDRLVARGSRLAAVRAVSHTAHEVARGLEELAQGGCDLILVLGASAPVDPGDVVPAGLERAGGRLHHFGIPVDPGNLLLTGSLGRLPVIGLPGCARSPRRSGFDLVLEHLLAGEDPASDTLTGLGVGGLLAEIPTRPVPRERGAAEVDRPAAGPVTGVVLAAGRSRRMGPTNKLLEPVDGIPMVARAVDTLLATGVDRVVVVTGHDADAVRDALADRPVRFHHNPRFAEGMGTSLAAGAGAAGGGWVLVMLGDMPRIRPGTVDRLLASARERPEGIHLPVYRGRRGHPVLWSPRQAAGLQGLGGDQGARSLLDAHPDAVEEVAVDDPGVLLDVDTAEALRGLEGSGREPRDG